MNMLYSKTTGGFYSTEVHSYIPEDAVTVVQADYEALLADQASGSVIMADANGKPIAVRPQPENPSVARKREILALLEQLDLQSVRPLRAKVAGTATADDERILAELESQAVALRAELATLG